VTVTLDSGIYISALQFGGVPKQALVHAIATADLLVCTQIEDEVVRVMHDKFNHSPQEISNRLSEYLMEAIRIAVTGKLSGICRDPNDDFILECATIGKADLIVTGDKDLLSLSSHGAISILTPRQYLDRVGDRHLL
jgi:putative PIN family toxin of toxin-antitoxin system